MAWNDYADQVQKKVLDAVSSLKRATGCPDSPKLKDAFVDDSTNLINIYTTVSLRAKPARELRVKTSHL